MKPLIVTGCTAKFERPFVKSWLPSLRGNGGYTGDVLFIDHGVSSVVREFLNARGCMRVPVHVEPGKYLQATHGAKKLIADFLDLNRDYTHVLMCCAGDLWFQRPIDGLWPFVDKSIGLVSEDQLCTSDWFIRQIGIMPRMVMHMVTEPSYIGQRMRNCGVVAGPADMMASLLHTTYMAVNYCTNFAADQVFVNYLIASKAPAFSFVELPREYNYIPAAFPWIESNGELCAPDGTPAIIGHNAGHRLFPRVVDGEDLNVENEYNT